MEYKELERILRNMVNKYPSAGHIVGRNFLTSNVIRTFGKNKKVIELSWGTGMFSDYMIGVTVKHAHSREDTGESTCFNETTLDELETFIKEL